MDLIGFYVSQPWLNLLSTLCFKKNTAVKEKVRNGTETTPLLAKAQVHFKNAQTKLDFLINGASQY